MVRPDRTWKEIMGRKVQKRMVLQTILPAMVNLRKPQLAPACGALRLSSEIVEKWWVSRKAEFWSFGKDKNGKPPRKRVRSHLNRSDSRPRTCQHHVRQTLRGTYSVWISRGMKAKYEWLRNAAPADDPYEWHSKGNQNLKRRIGWVFCKTKSHEALAEHRSWRN